jgi:hypothetical protein
MPLTLEVSLCPHHQGLPLSTLALTSRDLLPPPGQKNQKMVLARFRLFRVLKGKTEAQVSSKEAELRRVSSGAAPLLFSGNPPQEFLLCPPAAWAAQ